jgi:monoamine oxidase
MTSKLFLLFLVFQTIFSQTIYDVLIIGAGVSGIACADQLNKTNPNTTVILLEARNRILGRVHTSRDLGFAAEIGAQWIHGPNGNPLSELVSKFNVSTIATDFESEIFYDIRNGTGVELNSREKDKFAAGVAAVPTEMASSETDKSLKEVLDTIKAKGTFTPLSSRLWDLNLVLEQEIEYADNAKYLSAWYWKEAIAYPGKDVLMPNGYDQMFTPLAEKMNIKLNSEVSTVSLNAETGIVTVTVKGGTQYLTKKVVVSVPLGVLKKGSITFSPALPQDKLTSINRLGMGTLNKNWILFPKDSLVNLPGNFALIDTTDTFIQFINFRKLTTTDALMVFTHGDYARSIEGLTNQQISDRVLVLLKKIAPSIPNPISFQFSRWSIDPYAYGSYSFQAVGSTPKDYQAMAKTVGNYLFFAGEHAHTTRYSTVHGAYMRGIEVAKEIASMSSMSSSVQYSLFALFIFVIFTLF